MTDTSEAYVINMPRMIHETLDHETVVIDTETGVYFNIGGSGPLIFQMLESGATIATLIDAVATAYAVDVATVSPAVQAFLTELLVASIARRENAAILQAAPAISPGLFGAPFAPPVLHRFTDMEALLLVDPIHEVEERGWPYRR